MRNLDAKKAISILLSIIVAGLLLNLGPPLEEIPATADQQQTYLNAEEYAMLDEMFRVHINYFLSPEAITTFGLPLTAYKVGNRARYNWSNPTEWGYALQAWIAAAERGNIAHDDAVNKLCTALTTMQALQQNPDP